MSAPTITDAELHALSWQMENQPASELPVFMPMYAEMFRQALRELQSRRASDTAKAAPVVRGVPRPDLGPGWDGTGSPVE